MLPGIFKKTLVSLAAAGSLCFAGGLAQAANDNFEKDVGLSIDRGLAYLDTAGAFNNPSSAGDAAGLTLLALLEKRASGNVADPPQGYSGASAADQARMRRVIRYIIDRTNVTAFYAYRDGAFMMAVSLYMRTGGVDKDDGPTTELDGAPLTLIQTLNKLFDRVIVNQRAGLGSDSQDGYWCYSNNGCRDASTTQLVLAGLAGARAIYNAGGFAPDAARNAQLDTAALRSRKAYQANGVAGQAGATCGVLPNEKGHGYNAGNVNSLQQTASGTWAQLVGGADLNDADVQAYLRWIYHRYRYSNLNSANGGWSQSTWYYLWTSAKAFEFLEASGVNPSGANLEPADLGTLPAASAPACAAARQENRVPANDPRIPLFGANGPGYYDEEPDWYYDFAYTIMSHQCSVAQGSSGFYNCNSAPGQWDTYAHQSYAILVLQRSVGGGCVDTDGDGVCDDIDNCVRKENPDQADRDKDGVGDVCDNCPDVPNRDQADSNGNGIGDACEGGKCDLDKDGDIDKADIRVITGLRGTTSPPSSADADADGNGLININDARACTLKCTRPRCRLQ
jgi:hypothetical protein